MIYFYSIVLIILAGIWVCSKLMKPVLPLACADYSKPYLAAAVLICKGIEHLRTLIPGGGKNIRRGIKDKRLIANLRTLYPGESEDLHYYRYRVEKISIILLVITIGCFLGLGVFLAVMNQGVLEEGNVIYRSDYGGADVVADLSAGIQNNEELEEQNISISIPARVYSDEQQDEMFNNLSEKLDSLVLGQNDSADHIIHSLNLVKSVDGYPFSISWESSNYEYIDIDGAVHNEEIEDPVMIQMTADCVYEKQHRFLIMTFQVCPQELTLAEAVKKEVEEAVSHNNKESMTEESITLPGCISFGELSWKENFNDNSFLLILLTILICILVGPIRENEINRQIKARSLGLLNAYPSLVSKLTLYMGAGMSIRNCFLKLAKDYERQIHKKEAALGKELIIAAHEIQVGIPEMEVYENLGKRCGTREYMRFVALLNQNLRKGSTDLIRMLKEESEEAFDIRKNEARKLGEEASTKLLLPMIMMLSVVMIIIMVPAYMSFSS